MSDEQEQGIAPVDFDFAIAGTVNIPTPPADITVSETGDGSAVDLGIPDAGASLFRDNFTSPHVKADQHV